MAKDTEWKTIDEIALEFIKNPIHYPEMDYDAPYFKKLEVIKQYYLLNEAYMWDEYNKRKKATFNPYPYDWIRIMTPIEFLAWEVVRFKGLSVMPQYPVLNYYLDFANPFIKVGLELDGKQYHDADKDRTRDKRLQQEGWQIIRVTGSEMHNSNHLDYFMLHEHFEDEDIYEQIEQYFYNTGEGVMEAMKIVFWNGRIYGQDEYMTDRIRAIAHRSIDRHKLV